jgi:exodeoxyribonuclease VII large subunit
LTGNPKQSILARVTQLTFFQPQTWTVTDLTRYLRQLLENDNQLQDVWVQGEVSNLSRPGSGHLYFTLKDGGAALRCVMWRNAVSRQSFLPREGDAIELHGSISVYETSGQYQLYADAIRPSGEGALYQEFLRLKTRLEAEGLFASERKKPLPRWVNTIGIVTSPTGAALHDMLNVLRRRFPLVQVVLAPTQVQGAEAPVGIAAALRALNEQVKPDIILLARGGGSIEDLWAFNDERVARAIVSSTAPVITGVGHETDFTIADFAADLRAPTPTAAAELATPDQVDLRAALVEQVKALDRLAQARLSNIRWEIENLQSRLRLVSPLSRIRTGRQRLDDLVRRIETITLHNIELHQARLAGLEFRLGALSPLAVLQRGYALVSQSSGALVRSARQVTPGETLHVQVSDGRFSVSVLEKGIEPG